jgi:bifunctional non-homologous end joining protein LigD
MALDKYRRKRRFSRTPEPPGAEPALHTDQTFVVQKHQARRLHYDFRLAFDGVLKSWAVPKGPCLDPAERRLAVLVEDHPLEYADFEGAIPDEEYGGGTVLVWDQGVWEADEDLGEGLRKGSLKLRLRGKKLRGAWALVRMRPRPGETAENWLLIKERDGEARSLKEFDVLRESPESVLSGKTLEQVAASPPRTWTADRDRRSQPARKPPAARRRSWARRVAKVPGAKKAEIPHRLKPQLASPVPEPPPGTSWLHEIKFDGYRLIAALRDRHVALRTRSEQDWTDRFPDLAEAVRALPASSAMLDGEVVALLPSGVSSFQALQNAFRERRTGQLVYYVFDLVYLDGYDLRPCALEQRKRLLAELLRDSGQKRLQYTDHMEGEGPEFFRQCCRMGLEGSISKRRDRPYRSGRRRDWVKAKCVLREEFVIGGFTEPTGKRTGIGALLIGSFNRAGELTYHGRVGTGFTEEGLRELRRLLSGHQRSERPFVHLAPSKVARGTHWVEPVLVAQVEFSNWTDDGLVRHPSFQGLREDVSASSVVRDKSATAAAPPRAKTRRSRSARSKVNDPTAAPGSRLRISETDLAQLANLRLTSPDKVLYADREITKLGLASYYVQVSKWMLPHLVDRPLTILRGPEGCHGHCFYQKHPTPGMPEAIGRATIPAKGKQEECLVVRDLPGLVSLVQVGALEIHTWGTRVDRIDRPDRVVFDLDPDLSVSWPKVIEAARRLHDLLDDLGLVSFLKTSGGKGLHVVVPFLRRHGWDEILRFSKAVAHRLASDYPREYTATMSKAARAGKTYIDYHRNNRGATAVAAYSTRARPDAPVALPLFWKELSPAIGPDHFHVGNIVGRLASLEEDPWSDIRRVRQSVTASIRTKLQL